MNEKKGLTFARGLRSILRHDPDKIMVGEVRDPETAQIAVQSALTGHLVFTTVHANNVFDVIGRFMHMGVEPYNFVSALNCIVAQRLVRVLCAQLPAAGDVYDEACCGNRASTPTCTRDQEFCDADGCDECGGTGFLGRTAVAELLDMSDRIRQMILERRPVRRDQAGRAREEGMTLPARLRAREGVRRRHHAARDQQGHVLRLTRQDQHHEKAPEMSDTQARFENPPDAEIKALLEGARRIVVVGLSPKPNRDSHRVAAYMQSRGYEIVPVYPREDQILGAAGLPPRRGRAGPDRHRRRVPPQRGAARDDRRHPRKPRARHLAAARLHRRRRRAARPRPRPARRHGPLPDGGSRPAPRPVVDHRLS